jgi:hypothetical protein
VIDYSLDTNQFFPTGSLARGALEEAAEFYTNILNDTLNPIVPPVYDSPRTHVEWFWNISIPDPSGTSQLELPGPTIGADDYRIYVGARPHAAGTLAQAGPGGAGWGHTAPTGSPNSQDNTQISLINNAFNALIQTRGETSGFAAWGGSISFDIDTPWHFNHETPVPGTMVDLYTVALHELGHTLGLGASTAWNGLRNEALTEFLGPLAMAAYGGPVPLGPDDNHWAAGVGSTVYSGTATQTASLTPSVSPGIRKRVTVLDGAALVDIGWELGPLPGVQGDYNGDSIVNSVDYTIWRNTRGKSGPGLAADGNNNYSIDRGDYTIWKSSFGPGGAGQGGTMSTLVPEPNTAIYLFAATIALMGFRRRSRSKYGALGVF